MPVLIRESKTDENTTKQWWEKNHNRNKFGGKIGSCSWRKCSDEIHQRWDHGATGGSPSETQLNRQHLVGVRCLAHEHRKSGQTSIYPSPALCHVMRGDCFEGSILRRRSLINAKKNLDRKISEGLRVWGIYCRHFWHQRKEKDSFIFGYISLPFHWTVCHESPVLSCAYIQPKSISGMGYISPQFETVRRNYWPPHRTLTRNVCGIYHSLSNALNLNGKYVHIPHKLTFRT